MPVVTAMHCGGLRQSRFASFFYVLGLNANVW